MSAPSLRVGPVTRGHPRVSVLAWLDAAAATWTAADWEALRDAGVSLALVPPGLTVPFPSLPQDQVARGAEATAPGALFIDTAFQAARYPDWAEGAPRPWGPWVEGPRATALALAAVAAGAPLVVAPCPRPTALADLVAELKALASVLRRELTRVPRTAGPGGPAAAPAAGPLWTARSVAFQGEHGAFSEMAVFTLFTKGKTGAVPFPAFGDVFQAVLEGRVDYGMVPIENALAGPVSENYDLLLDYPDLEIVAETQVRVEHNLIGFEGTPLTAVKRVFSHPQGLAQTRPFLASHPGWEAVPFYDTAGAVKHVAQVGDRSQAAIASAEAARVYGLSILVAGVETNRRNFTRFFLIAPRGRPRTGRADKVSLVFATPDEPGALSRCLAVFANHGVNMTKLESRPIHGRPWDYMFYVDARLPAEAGAFDRALADLAAVTQDLRVLGVYPGSSPSS